MATTALVARPLAGWIARLGWMFIQGRCMICTMNTPATQEVAATLEVQVDHGVPEVQVEAACGGRRWPGGPRGR
eukprot:130877-Lingulodinium_polyedra.AAC.1